MHIYTSLLLQFVSAITTENDGTGKKERSRTHKKSKLIIIISGVLISTGLLLLIGREIYQKMKVYLNHSLTGDSSVEFNVYAEIDPPSQRNVINEQ